MSSTAQEFDSFATRYEEALSRGLGVTGEDSTFYAQERIKVLFANLGTERNKSIERILDFGCGTGGSRPWIYKQWPDADYVGYDPSSSSLAVANERHSQPKTSWSARIENLGQFDLVLTNGVFHHIAPADRGRAFTTVHKALKPSGIFAFFENNPWNPGTRYIMSRVEFDRDAITITPSEARRLMRQHGFATNHFTSLFYFPSSLACLRPLEKWLGRLPLGGQYLYISAHERE
jgi:SAM-dependent methyltransferase